MILATGVYIYVVIVFVPLCSPPPTAKADGRVENWMNDVLDEMRLADRYVTKTCIYDFGTDLMIAR